MSAGHFLARAFDVLECDELAAFTRMGDALAGLTIACTVDTESFFVSGAGRPRVLAAAPGAVKVRVESSRAAILDLIDGETDFLAAVLARRLRLTADIDLMVRLSRAQRAFAEGAARARRMRLLLDEMRAATALTAGG